MAYRPGVDRSRRGSDSDTAGPAGMRPSLTPTQLEFLRQLAIPNGRAAPAGFRGTRPWSRRRVYPRQHGEYLIELAADIVPHRRRAFDRADVAVLFRAGLTVATIPIWELK